MFYSATASFIIAAITAAIAALALSRLPRASFIPLALIPLFFAVQQGIEGLIWLRLETGGDPSTLDGLATLFVLIGEGLWPIWIPLSVALVETAPRRRSILAGLTLFGAVLSAGFIILIIIVNYRPEIDGGAIHYSGWIEISNRFRIYPFAEIQAWRLSGLDWTVIPYSICTIGALLLSSRPRLRWFGYVCAVGLIAALLTHRMALVSIWGFVAAICSVFILLAILAERRTADAGKLPSTQIKKTPTS